MGKATLDTYDYHLGMAEYSTVAITQTIKGVLLAIGSRFDDH